MMRGHQLHEGQHLPKTQHASQATKTSGASKPLVRRYALNLPNESINAWGASSSSCIKNVFGVDKWGKSALALFQAALQPRTYKNFGSALTGFIEFCGETGVDYLEVTPVEIAWLGERGTVPAGSLQPYLSAINRFLSDHVRAPMVLGPMITSVKKGLGN